ncbi:hypothetical protein BH23GEM3_BH23GEM3_00810 [soil metagenome]
MKLPWRKDVAPAERVLLLAAVACLLATVTNLVPLSAGLALPAVLAPFLLVRRRTVPRITAALALLLGYFSVWTVIYDPASLAEYAFFRRDGNVFITYAPLLFLSLLHLDLRLDSLVRAFLYVAGALNVVFLGIYAVTGGTIFFYEEGIYHFLFHAHNAAGGFLAVTTAMSAGYFYATREGRFLLLTATNFLGLLAADSRGSMLGLLMALGIVFVLRGRFMRTAVLAMIVVQLAGVVALHRISSPEIFLRDYPGELDFEGGAFDALPRVHTVALRALYLWPRAWHLFQASPLVGTGFGSYNDLPLALEGMPPLYRTNQPDIVVHSDAHAHHTFLHVLAETGVLGLGLLIGFLVQARRFILSIRLPALRYAFELVLWVNIVSSFTEHRLFTPSQMLPFVILLGLAVANREFERLRAQRAVLLAGDMPAPVLLPAPRAVITA